MTDTQRSSTSAGALAEAKRNFFLKARVRGTQTHQTALQGRRLMTEVVATRRTTVRCGLNTEEQNTTLIRHEKGQKHCETTSEIPLF